MFEKSNSQEISYQNPYSIASPLNIGPIFPYSQTTYLILLKERSAHIAIQRIGKVILQIGQSRVEHLTLLGIIDRHDKEGNEPGERVLVHGVNVREVSDAEEEDGRVDGDWLVAHTRLIDLLFCHFGRLHWPN